MSAERFAERQFLDDEALRVVLSTREGRHFVRMVLATCEWNQEVFAADPIILAGRVGRQTAGIRLHQLLEDRQPALLAKVFEEARELERVKESDDDERSE